MKRHAKAASVGSIGATGNSRVRVSSAFATRGARNGSRGSSAPSTGRVARTLAVLALAVAAFALTAAPASAAPPTVEMGAISDVSYASARVTGKLSSTSEALTAYIFQYSTDEKNWIDGSSELLAGGAINDKFVKADLSGLKGGTKYFVRLAANNGFIGEPIESTSPKPNPSFTTLAVDPPTIPGTVAASPVLSTSATGTAKIKRPANSDPAFDTKCHFEYVTDVDFKATGFAGATVRDCQQNPIGKDDADTEKEVIAPLGCTSPATEAVEGKCLSPNTTYHLRLVAENASPTVVMKEAAGTFTALPPVAKPVVLSTDDATNVGKRGAQASGKIERPAGADPALDVNCRFEYVTDADFKATGFADAGQSPCAENPVTSPASGNPAVSADVKAELSGLLIPGATYHLRLAAENGGGIVSKEAAGTFTTIAIVPPTITIDSVSDIGYASVRITGTADPGNQGISGAFEYSPVGKEEWSGSELGAPIGLHPPSPAQQYSVEFPCFDPAYGCALPLKPGTTYQVRGLAYEQELGGPFHSDEPYLEFTTKGTSTPPSVSLDPVAPITATTAHFPAAVDTHAPAGPLPDEAKDAYRTDWHFECTPECPPNVDLSGVVEAEEGSKSISVDAIRLEPNTSYEVKLIAHNRLETVETARTFKTPLVPPAVKSAPGGSDGNGGYILEGIVNPNNSLVTDCKFEWGPNLPYAFSAPCLPAPGDKAKPVTVEAHLTGLTPDAVYHAKLVATNSGGSADSGDFTFIPTLDPKDPCANDQQRQENSSLALPECRAYEQVSDPSKEGVDAYFGRFAGDDTVQYVSSAGNIANSGSGWFDNYYTTIRSSTGWETVANLNGPTGSQYTGEKAPDGTAYVEEFSADLLSSLWNIVPKGAKPVFSDGTMELAPFLRRPNGSFVRIGDTVNGFINGLAGFSDDFSHLVYNGAESSGYTFGPGVYEFVGTGNGLPERIDVDNSGDPVSACAGFSVAGGVVVTALSNGISNDGRVLLFTVAGGCGGASPPVPNPPANEIWARVSGTASIHVSASQCTRGGADPCNAPTNADFEAAAKDGSRVFFTTTQQLLNGDTDQSKDLYACDIPSGPLTSTGTANSCSALRQVSAGYPAGAEVERVLRTSEDGSTAYFVARGVLAGNEDAFGNKAKFGDPNLYVWRTGTVHPDGQTTFATRLDTPDSSGIAQITPDGRYAVLSGTDRLVLTDNDDAKDLFRYDAETGEIVRVSTNVSGTGGNGTFDTRSGGISDDGQKIVFTTVEALAPVDGNEELDPYLWSASTGRVYLIGSGSVGGGSPTGSEPAAAISGSGKNVYFNTRQVLTPSDIDNTGDTYTARIGGGFSFAQKPSCVGEDCQPEASVPPVVPPPAAPNPQGNVRPKLCPKGKVAKGQKCVKKPKKKHSKRKAKDHAKRASHNRGGSK